MSLITSGHFYLGESGHYYLGLTVGNDNCVRFENLVLQIPPDRHRCHYVKAKVRFHRYSNGRMAIFHGPRKLVAYDALGKEIKMRNKAIA